METITELKDMTIAKPQPLTVKSAFNDPSIRISDFTRESLIHDPSPMISVQATTLTDIDSSIHGATALKLNNDISDISIHTLKGDFSPIYRAICRIAPGKFKENLTAMRQP